MCIKEGGLSVCIKEGGLSVCIKEGGGGGEGRHLLY